MTKKEFDVLLMISEAKESLSQRHIAEKLKYSLGTVNKILKDFNENGITDGYRITEKGYKELEPYRVKRAIFIAAGFSSKLVPITLNTPKPLVRVNGTRIIDTALEAIVKAQIPEIVIVRGYLGEEFDQLLYKFPQIKFVENPAFNEYNNIASAMCVRYLFKNSYVLDADLILKNPNLIRKYEYQSNILGVPTERTDDWCLTADKSGYVTDLTLGGLNGFREVGISYWTEEDGAKLADDLYEVYNSPGGKQRYWEETCMVYKKEHYNVAVRECSADDFTEIDTFSELKKIDSTYNL